MAIQTGKFTKALSLNTNSATQMMSSDTVNIPFAGSAYKSGTVNAGLSTGKLLDSSANFLSTGANALNVQVGDIVWNTSSTVTTDLRVAVVTNVDSATALSLSANIMLLSNATYRLFRANEFMNGTTIPCYLLLGNGGTVRVLTAGGDDVTFYSTTANSLLPVQVVRLFKTGTTLTSATALW